MTELLEYLSDVIVDAVFPHKCSCGRWGTPICENCYGSIKTPKTDLCPICKKISELGRVCTSCRHRTGLTGVMIVGPHEDVLKDAIWRLKYGSISDLAPLLADLAITKYGDFLLEKRFVVTFTPTTSQRRRARGYNQAELLAGSIAAKLGLALAETLTKIRDTGSQVGRSRKERLRNMKGSFAAIADISMSSRRVLVIDDVYTSGATLEEAARVLREAGFREVWGLVLSRD